MTILTRHEINELKAANLLVFTPKTDAWQDQPHAVDLRLGTQFYLPRTWQLTPEGRRVVTIDPLEETADAYEQIELKMGQFFELAPGEAIIASTLEKVDMKVPDVMGILYPRSSVNRRGLSVDLTGIVDAHYSGHLMIPIHNRTRQQIIRLYPGERICQIVFERLERPLERDDALRHGAQTAKYEGARDTQLGGKTDANAEVAAIKNGTLR